MSTLQSAAGALPRSRPARRSILNIIVHNQRAFVGLLMLVGFIMLAIIGPMVVPFDNTQRFLQRLQGPSLAHPFGTDHQGKDTAMQFVHGSASVILLSVATAVFTLLIAFVVGGLAGVAGGRLDALLMFITDIILTVPSFPIMMVLSMVITISDPISFALVLSIWSWAGLARAIRAQIL
ncbi:MAG: peptide/nickel transport system permease protein, partial [Chloroflexota bacterium]|nr:peptide/nickel transport system permease protein [Chloroflexota bacterium]